MNKTVIIVKPGFESYVDEVIAAYGNIGYAVTKRKETTLTQEQVNIIWSDIKEKVENGKFKPDYFTRYSEYMMSSPVTCLVLVKEDDSDYKEVDRLKLQLRREHNARGMRDLLHTSDSNELAQREEECLFD